MPQRQYFLFGQPFQTSQEHYKDKEKGAELYKEVQPVNGVLDSQGVGILDQEPIGKESCLFAREGKGGSIQRFRKAHCL